MPEVRFREAGEIEIGDHTLIIYVLVLIIVKNFEISWQEKEYAASVTKKPNSQLSSPAKRPTKRCAKTAVLRD